MTEAKPDKSFILQKHSPTSDREPLELHHLSHDLRGPLNSILGFAELLIEEIEGPLNDIQTEDISAIYQSAQTLLRLINTVVDLSKLEAERLALNFGPVQLDNVVQKVVSTEFGGDRANQIELTLNIPEPFPLLWGDYERVEQMVFNLVRFALKIKDVKQIKIMAEAGEKNALLKIAAVEGLLTAEDAAGLFELTVEVNHSGHGKLSKGGLELPMVYKLVKAHQGQVWVESETEAETAFYLQLPLYQPE